jgi:hypothetical protein
MGWDGDIAKDAVKGVVSAATLAVATFAWQHFFGTTPESALKKASTPIQLLNWEVWLWAAITVFLVVFIAATLLRRRSPGDASSGVALDPKIEIVTTPATPYHETVPEGGRVKSTVRIGIKNVGGKTLSNCRVYIEKIAPPAALPGADSHLLKGDGFHLRHDDPEKLIDVAVHWDHTPTLRFCTPPPGGFFGVSEWIEDSPRRTFVIRVTATECEVSAAYEIWTDESRRLHLTLLNSPL